MRGQRGVLGSPVDLLMAQAADRVILTAERIVAPPSSRERRTDEISDLDGCGGGGATRGASGRLPGCDEVDEAGVRRYLDAARRPTAFERTWRRLGDGRPVEVQPAGTVGDAELLTVALARLLRDGEVACHGVNSVLPSLAIALARRLTRHGFGTSPSAAGWTARRRRYRARRRDPTGSQVRPRPVQRRRDTSWRSRPDRRHGAGRVQVDRQGRVTRGSSAISAAPRAAAGRRRRGVLFQVVRRVLLSGRVTTPGRRPAGDFVTATGNLDRV